MKNSVLVILFLFGMIACSDRETESSVETVTEAGLDWKKWKMKREGNYPFREEMYMEVLYSDSLRTLSKTQILDLLGKPDRTNGEYIYYIIDESNLGFWTLNSKSLVFKFTTADSVEWIKLHE
jgi:hypothetical protein